MSHCTCYPHAYKASCRIHGPQDDSPARAQQSLTDDAGDEQIQRLIIFLRQHQNPIGADIVRGLHDKIVSSGRTRAAAKPSSADTDRALEEVARLARACFDEDGMIALTSPIRQAWPHGTHAPCGCVLPDNFNGSQVHAISTPATRELFAALKQVAPQRDEQIPSGVSSEVSGVSVKNEEWTWEMVRNWIVRGHSGYQKVADLHNATLRNSG